METYMLIGPVVALAGPWLLWPLEQMLPAEQSPLGRAMIAAVIEEGFKLGLVAWALRLSGRVLSWPYLGLIGLGFGMSETILYLFNALQSGGTGVYWLRLITAVPMHVLTVLVMGWGFRARLPWLGLVAALLIHAGYNWIVRGL